MNVPRWLSPKTNPALYTAAIGIAFSIWQAIQVQAASGPLTWQQVGRIAGGVVLAAIVYGPQRRRQTPVADPRDANGNPLTQAASPIIKLTGSVNQEYLDNLKKALADTKPLSDSERRRAEDMRLTLAPGTPSFYPYPGEPPVPAQPPASTP